MTAAEIMASADPTAPCKDNGETFPCNPETIVSVAGCVSNRLFTSLNVTPYLTMRIKPGF